jgi:hypothetical protein
MERRLATVLAADVAGYSLSLPNTQSGMVDERISASHWFR